jgi:WXG100 family type VII secretion target
MAQLNTDEVAMARAASQFDANAAQLKSNLHMIESIGDGLVPQLRGQTGTAAQAALARYKSAQLPVITELDTISQNIRESGMQYGGTDSDGASFVQSAFHL